jgi:putative acetyltransferase
MSAQYSFILRPARTPEHLSAIKSLFTTYSESLGIDLTYQDFASELATLPGKYSHKSGGELLLAFNTSGEAIGCVGLRPLDQASNLTRCEMKRLYITPSARGVGAGKGLLDWMMKKARELGYEEIVLDTLQTMEKARGMYKSVGFVETEAYYDSPVEGTVFMKLVL